MEFGQNFVGTCALLPKIPQASIDSSSLIHAHSLPHLTGPHQVIWPMCFLYYITIIDLPALQSIIQRYPFHSIRRFQYSVIRMVVSSCSNHEGIMCLIRSSATISTSSGYSGVLVNQRKGQCTVIAENNRCACLLNKILHHYDYSCCTANKYSIQTQINTGYILIISPPQEHQIRSSPLPSPLDIKMPVHAFTSYTSHQISQIQVSKPHSSFGVRAKSVSHPSTQTQPNKL